MVETYCYIRYVWHIVSDVKRLFSSDYYLEAKILRYWRANFWRIYRQQFPLLTDDAVLHAYTRTAHAYYYESTFTGWNETEWSEAEDPLTWQRATTHCRTHQNKRSRGSTLPHPPYSSDLAPADYALFLRLKRLLRGRIFESRHSLENDVCRIILPSAPSWWRRYCHRQSSISLEETHRSRQRRCGKGLYITFRLFIHLFLNHNYDVSKLIVVIEKSGKWSLWKYANFHIFKTL